MQNLIDELKGKDKNIEEYLAQDLVYLKQMREVSLKGMLKWGGDDPVVHDKGHDFYDWVDFIDHQLDSSTLTQEEMFIRIGGIALSALRALRAKEKET